MQEASPTDVPPNFMTCKCGFIWDRPVAWRIDVACSKCGFWNGRA
jgi:hypothetical protein